MAKAMRLRDYWEIDEGGVAGSVIDALRGFYVVGGLGVKNVGDEGLRVAVVEREERGLHLNHDAMAGEEDVVHGGQAEAIEQRLIGHDGFGMPEAGAVAAAENVERNGEFVATHDGLRGHSARVDVDELDDPIAVGAAGGGVEIHFRHAADANGCSKRFGFVGEYVLAAIYETLIVDEPAAPRVAIITYDRASFVWHGRGWIGNIFVELSCCRCERSFKRQSAVRGEIQRARFIGAALCTTERPGFEAVPMIFAGVVDEDRRRISFGSAVEQILIEEWKQNVAAELQRGVSIPEQRAERITVIVDLTMAPGTHH